MKYSWLRLSFILVMMIVGQCATAVERQPRIVGGEESVPGQWTFMTALMHRSMGLAVGDSVIQAALMQNAPTEEVEGPLANCERAVEPCADVQGKICLIERDGIVEFETKAQNCAAGGGLGAVIYNNLEGLFTGVVSIDSLDIPVLSISRDDGLALLNQLGETASYQFSDEAPVDSFCGGSYIGGNWVVTAAHCTDGLTAEAIAVNIGGHDLSVDQDNVIPVIRVVNHPDYDPDTVQNDLALLELASVPTGVQAVPFGDSVMLETAILDDRTVTILGRGGQEALEEDDDPGLAVPVAKLFEAELSLTTNESCAQALLDFTMTSNPFGIAPALEDVIFPETFCAGRPEGGIGACFGDSGGPLLLVNEGQPFLLGLTSWGIGCAQPDLYDVYTRLPLYKNEIEQILAAERSAFSSASDSPVTEEPDEPITEQPESPGDKVVEDDDDGIWGIGGVSPWVLLLAAGLGRVGRFRRLRS